MEVGGYYGRKMGPIKKTKDRGRTKKDVNTEEARLTKKFEGRKMRSDELRIGDVTSLPHKEF